MNNFRSRIFLAALALLMLVSYPLQCSFAKKLSNDEERLMKAYQRGEIIRLHIIANSNSAADQKVKFAIRDAITANFGISTGHKKSDEVYTYWKNNLDVLQKIATDTANNLGYFGKIQTEAGVFMLPEKKYGSILLPAGKYKTIRITLGKAAGQNWWCVLYPQLCMSLTTASDTTPSNFTCLSARIFRLWFAIPF